MNINIEKNFMVSSNSTWHAPTNMANTLQELCKKIRIHHCHCSVPGSQVEAQVSNVLVDGLGECYQAYPEDIDLGNASMELGLLEVDDFDAMWWSADVNKKMTDLSSIEEYQAS